MRAALLLTLMAGQVMATTITYVGADTTNGARWRTASVVKTLDADGDNIYGTDGYLLLTSPGGVVQSVPGYISSIVRLAPFNWYGGLTPGALYIDVDNPVAPGVIRTGSWYGASGSIDVFARITVQANATFRLGVLVDAFDAETPDVSPLTLRVDQIFAAPPLADSGFVTANLEPNRDGDWYFFDIQADAGDVLHISGQNWNQGVGGFWQANAIAGLSFDTIPEPSTYALMGLGLLGMAAARRRVSR